MSRYASSTTVTPRTSRDEVERTVERYGGSHFAFINDPERPVISFRYAGRMIRMSVLLPDAGDYTSRRAHDQANRQRWRALALVVKATLESIESGIMTADEALLPWIVLPDGRTYGEAAAAQIADIYRTGQIPPGLELASDHILLPPPGST